MSGIGDLYSIVSLYAARLFTRVYSPTEMIPFIAAITGVYLLVVLVAMVIERCFHLLLLL